MDKACKQSQQRISRRAFLKGASTATASFAIVPNSVLAGRDKTAPSERVNLGIIGTGGQGMVNAKWLLTFPDVQIMSICDVNKKSDYGEFYFKGVAGREPAQRVIEDYYAKERPSGTYKGCSAYADYNEMLAEETGLDAVLVATTDNLHAPASMAALRKRKHVYCEKPLTKTVVEARRLAEAARQYDVATQMGNQGQASDESRLLCEMIWDGAIGDIHEVHVWTNKPGDMWYQGIERPKKSHPHPAGLDWDRWLGPAPFRPYHPMYAPFRWRGWCDFGTGVLGDIACHSFHPVFRALKLKHPLSVETKSTAFNRETYPLASTVYYEFGAREGMPPVRLVWYDNGLQPPTPEELEPGRSLGRAGTLFIGSKGKILNNRIIPLAKMKAYQMPPKTMPRSPGHHREWINACKGGAPGGSDFNIAGPLTEAVLLGNVSLQVGKKVYWDPEILKVWNAPEAEKYLHRPYRDGWIL